MPTKRVDELRALPDQTLMRPECDRAPLGLGALHRHEAHGRAQGSRRDSFRVRDRARLYRTVPSGPKAQTWKLPFARSIASMLIFVIIGVPSIRFRWNHHGI